MQRFKLFLILWGLLMYSKRYQTKQDLFTFCNEKSMTPPKCLHYAVLDKEDKTLLEKHFGVIDDPTCSFRVELTKYHADNCNNPIVKSTGSDFDGYVRIEIKKGFKCYYKIQSDYKNDADAAFERVLKKVKIDLNL